MESNQVQLQNTAIKYNFVCCVWVLTFSATLFTSSTSPQFGGKYCTFSSTTFVFITSVTSYFADCILYLQPEALWPAFEI